MTTARATFVAFVDAVSGHDTTRVEALLAPRLRVAGFDDVPASELLQTLGHLWGGFPDLRVEIVDVVAGDDVAWGRLRMHGHHTGPFQGGPPTGRAIDVVLMVGVGVSAGRIVAQDVSVDRLALQQQLGWVDAPARAA